MEKKKYVEEFAFERWEKRNQRKGNDIYFEEEEREESYLKDLKGRVQNNLSGFLRVMVTALIVLVQIGLLLILPIILRGITVYFYFILEIISVIAIITLVNRNQSPSYRLAWVSIALLLPISGFLMYFLWGRSSRNRKKLNRQILEQIEYGKQFLIQDQEVLNRYIKEHPVSERMVKYMNGEGFQLTAGNDVEFYSMGEDVIEAMFHSLERAKEFIFIDFFIVAEGAVWDKLHQILKSKIEEGVEVRFLYDDFGGAIRTRKYFRQILEREGFQVQVFNPIHKYTGELYMNYRSHQKIVVIDGKVGFTGGINIADEYANLIERFGVWKDTGIKVKGDGVWGLTVVFLHMWEACANNKEHIDYLKYKKEFPKPEKTSTPEENTNETYCQVIWDGPANNPDNPIESLYNQMIVYADQYLYVTTPYLVIEDYMKQTLIEAVSRGVDIRIITPGIADKKQVKMLTNYNYGPLLERGVRIYEYQPGFIHAKQILTEDAAIVGTINMDYRSFYLHYENGVWMTGKKIQEVIKKDFEQTFAQSKEITYEEWLHRPRLLKMVQPILNLFSTLF